MNIYIETGQKKVIAGAVDWPGWCRIQKSEEAAIELLQTYRARYARVLEGSGLSFHDPGGVADFVIVERHVGDSTTDFGAPSVTLDMDRAPVSELDFEHFAQILEACWRALDAAAEASQGRELRKGSRGGGRDLEKILLHVYEGHQGYLRRLAWRGKMRAVSETAQVRQDTLDALSVAVFDGLPETGPRGGKLWTPRYFVRRAAWHILDHAWEIEDRII
jgi:hypothetical protein